MTSSLIRSTQQMLKDLGYDPNGVDGIWGAGSERAFQRLSKDMDPTGKLGTRSTTAGMSRDQIKTLQQLLDDLGYNPKGVDGIWGNGSSQAFQAMTIDPTHGRKVSRDKIRNAQQMLLNLKFSPGSIDGLWGANTEKAIRSLVASKASSPSTSTATISWGSKLTVEEIRAIQSMITRLGMKSTVNDMMACMAFESGGTFSPSIQNKSTKATGLVQIMPNNAIAYGTTVDKLAKMTVIQQLTYVAKHFQPYGKRINDLGDNYMSILWPRAIGKPDNYALWTLGERAYMYNDGLDINKDGKVTKMEALHYIKNRFVQGFTKQYVRKI